MSDHFFSKHNSAETQRHRILLALRAGLKTSKDLRNQSIYQNSVHTFELRERGFEIKTDRVSLFNREGYEHRGRAMYELVNEPEQVQANDHH